MIKVVAYTVDVCGNNILIQDSEGESVNSSDVRELLAFLNEPYSDRDTFAIKVFWDLDTAISPILRKLGINACRQLASPSHAYENIFYIPSKIFCIEGNENKSFFYHLAQYYPDEEEQDDVETIAGMASNILDAFKAMGLHPKKLTSPIAVYEAEVLRHMQIPTILNIPGKYEELIEYAEDCIGRLWIQAYQIGHWDVGEIYEYDMRSAYPAISARLRSLQYAKYVKAKHIPSEHEIFVEEEPDWGFMRGKVTIYDGVNISPIFYNNGSTNIHPTGTWETTITLQEYRFINKWKIGEFKIDDGYFIKFTAPVMPLEVAMKRLFNQRGQGGLINGLAKRIATGGAYGKFIEKHEDGSVGAYYNPIYAAMINSIANLKIAEFIYQNNLQDDVVHIGVDSVMSTKEATKGVYNGNTPMGCWRLSGIGAALVLSSGRVYHGDKKPQGLNYDEIISLIRQHPRETFYRTILKRRQTLEESIQLNDLNGLGKMKDVSSSFDINLLKGTTDRVYRIFPINGHELLSNQYKSKPISIK